MSNPKDITVTKPLDQDPSREGAFVLSYHDVARVLGDIDLGDLIARLADQIEAVYRDSTIAPVKRLGWSTPPNALEIMGCQGDDLTCVKLISSVPATNGSPTVTGTLVCTETGTDQARLVCDAAFLTPLRTAATTGVVMRAVAPSARTLGIAGAGLEGIAHAVSLTYMVDSIEAIRLFDLDRSQATRAAAEIQYLLGRNDLLGGRAAQVHVCETEHDLYESDAFVTATYAERDTEVLTDASEIGSNTFIAAVGADLQNKRELPGSLYKRARFVADDLEQCLEDGELQYAKDMWSADDFAVSGHRGELAGGLVVSVADLLAGPEQFLSREEGVTIYDSVGFSGQDLAVARVMLEVLSDCDWPRQPWNPGYSRSLVDLLGCAPSPAPEVTNNETSSSGPSQRG